MLPKKWLGKLSMLQHKPLIRAFSKLNNNITNINRINNSQGSQGNKKLILQYSLNEKFFNMILIDQLFLNI